jgi:glycosyltransferase involved in cell wall biosynthesis
VRSAGVKTYLYHWLHSLDAARPGFVRRYLAPAEGGLNHDRGLNHDGGPRHHFLKLAALSVLNRTGGILADFAVPRCDVFHISNLLHHPPRGPKLSATVHDLTSWIVPQCQTAVNVKADTEFARRVLVRANGLIAVSENTRQDAMRILGIHQDKIRVIHLGVPEAYFSAVVPAEPRFPYFLFVGTIEPRKNVDSLLSAWASLRPEFRQEHQLRIAGMKGWNSAATMRRLAQMSKDDPSIKYLGYVPEAAMPSLVAGAKALVYPSLYEGFGIPVVQAMAAGCPVITSNVSSLPEVAGDAALLVDPLSVTELADAMRRLGVSQALRDTLRLRGMARAKHFTWERAAAESLQYFTGLAATAE